MQKLKNSEKSRGIVAFAVNTGTTDYVAIANKTVPLASQVLGLPYTIITEESIAEYARFSTRTDVDTGLTVEWKNVGRNSAYKLSPYDETLVIDVDYVVQDDSLLDIFDISWDYLLQRHSRSLNDEHMPPLMGKHSLPYVWATVFAFRRTPKAEMFFNLIERIQENYSYYRELFNIPNRTYRNDYAFAMADIILNGFRVRNDVSIPGWMVNVTQTIDSIEARDNKLIIKDRDAAYVIPKMNLHVMSKKYLQSENFDKFIANVTA
jgi:hypothetical protein